MFGVLVIFAVLSFRDAYRFRVSKNPDDVTLQLPFAIKERIHRILRGKLGGKATAAGAFIAGSAVTALESVCTGQIYVPTLVFVLKSGEADLRGWMSLLVYNGMFILPLVVVLLLTYRGMKTQRLIDWSTRNVVGSKILIGCLFAALAVIIILI